MILNDKNIVERNDRFARTELLFNENLKKFHAAKVVIFGVGGVGGFVLDSLYRTGFKDILIVDKDDFDVTNQNRQIGAEFVGESKVLVLSRIYPGIKTLKAKVDKEFLSNFNSDDFDYIVDAIDDIEAKVMLAKACINKPYGKFICSTGSAKKINPLEIKVSSVFKSYGDKFARKLRDNLKKQGVKKNYKVVFSPEPPKCKGLGSFSAVTASFGLQIASEIVQDLIKG